ncbi:hypothetical protein SAY86_015189 [Trapa natans]|uniref:Uncharacterized protein n=1 Tax=Trapa natans TaxID=22666 RepID=A0AAN7KHE0_TRANT|nr:hypothetical protein SAY86_015189 [Trapa natans]
MARIGVERWVVSMKVKLMRTVKKMKKGNEDYDKIEKSESMRVEIRSRKARKLIEETLKIADSNSSFSAATNKTKSTSFLPFSL